MKMVVFWDAEHYGRQQMCKVVMDRIIQSMDK
jgi:hypothetical protein